jgi:hypothetical protein
VKKFEQTDSNFLNQNKAKENVVDQNKSNENVLNENSVVNENVVKENQLGQSMNEILKIILITHVRTRLQSADQREVVNYQRGYKTTYLTD